MLELERAGSNGVHPQLRFKKELVKLCTFSAVIYQEGAIPNGPNCSPQVYAI